MRATKIQASILFKQICKKIKKEKKENSQQQENRTLSVSVCLL